MSAKNRATCLPVNWLLNSYNIVTICVICLFLTRSWVGHHTMIEAFHFLLNIDFRSKKTLKKTTTKFQHL